MARSRQPAGGSLVEAARRDPASLTRQNPHAPLTVSAGVSGLGGAGETRVEGGGWGSHAGLGSTPPSPQLPPPQPPPLGSPLCAVCEEINGVTQSGSPFTVLARWVSKGGG